MTEKEYYEQDDLWKRPAQPFQERVRIDLLKIIPDGVENLLDVGCGNGHITNALPEQVCVVGTDLSAVAIGSVRRDRMLSSISELPICQKSFDLVQAIDVIEHIPEATYSQALLELERVARKYILIGVPFMENLESGLTKCGACGRTYHINHHYRSYGVKELIGLFSGRWKARQFVFSGDTVGWEAFLLRFFRGYFRVPTAWDMAVCPYCGAKKSTKGVDEDTERGVALLSQCVPRESAPLYPDRTECLVLFEKNLLVSMDEPGGAMLELLKGGGKRENRLFCKPTIHGGQTVLELLPEKEQDLTDDDTVWLCLCGNGRTYYYPNPERLSSRKFVVPAWFTLDHLEVFSCFSRVWTAEQVRTLILQGMRRMGVELAWRRRLKGALCTLWEGLGQRLRLKGGTPKTL